MALTHVSQRREFFVELQGYHVVLRMAQGREVNELHFNLHNRAARRALCNLVQLHFQQPERPLHNAVVVLRPPAHRLQLHRHFRWQPPVHHLPTIPESLLSKLLLDGKAAYKAAKYDKYLEPFLSMKLPFAIPNKGEDRERYTAFVLAMRKWGRDPKQQDLVIQRFAGWEAFPYLVDSVCHLVAHYRAALSPNVPQLPELTLASLTRFISDMNEMVMNSPSNERVSLLADAYSRLQGAAGVKDFLLSSNLPHPRQFLQITDGAKIRDLIYLRHPCPTMNDSAVKGYFSFAMGFVGLAGSSGERIADDYADFVTATGQRKEGILFVSLQRPWKTRENEQDRVAALVGLEKKNPNVYLLIQPVEGPLFTSHEIHTLAQLQEALLYAFTTPIGALGRDYLPSRAISDMQKRNFLLGVLGVTKKLFFPHQREDRPITHDERLIYIHLFYFMQRMELLVMLPINYLATVCKDDIDRGGVQAFIHDLLMLYITGAEPTRERLEELVYNLLGPAVMIRKGEVLEKRLHEGLRVADFLYRFLSKKENLQRLQSYAFHGAWRVKSASVMRPQSAANAAAKK